MFILVFLAFLGSLQASPIRPNSSDALPTHAESTWRRDVALAGNGDNLRSTYGIVWSCVVTVFACVWSSAHPNIPGPRDAGWTHLKRRAVAMLCALIAPEMIALWAIRHIAANKFAKDYNENVAKSSPPIKALWERVREWFTELPETEAQRSSQQPWSMTHGFFIQMGGFVLYEDGRAARVLVCNDLKALILEDKVDAPTVTTSEIKDRSKGDAISKGFVVLQTTWFVIQCVARLSRDLPLSEVEVVTLSFAVLNGFIYALWWNKPQDVGVAIPIPLKKAGADERQRIAATDSNRTAGASEGNPTDTVEKRVKTASNEKRSFKDRWLGQHLAKDRSRHHWLFFALVMVPRRCLETLLRPLPKIGDSFVVPVGALRVPMFYTARRGNATMTGLTSCVVGIIFGAVHLLAWSSDFPSRRQLFLWRLSTVIITAEPALLMTGILIALICFKLGERERLERALKMTGGKALAAIFGIAISVAGLSYVAARLTLIILAFRSLHSLSPAVFTTIPWTSFIPHL